MSAKRRSARTKAEESPALVIFQGGASPSASALEQLVADAQSAATLDLLERATRSKAFNRAFLVTEDQRLVKAANSLAEGWDNVVLVAQGTRGKRFHFGESLRAICREHDLKRVVYIGGGAMPLATEQVLADLALSVSGDAASVVANNLYSSDVIGFSPSSALDGIELPATDNDLAWLLHYRAGLPFTQMPRTLASQFDVDTPTDLATLAWAGKTPPVSQMIGRQMASVVSQAESQLRALMNQVERAYAVMATRRAEVLLAGRVSSFVWRRLETNLPCQTRVVSEERGMRASGREDRGEARSLLGLYADLAGAAGLVGALEQLCQAAFIDSRVLFAHRNLHPSAQDRFSSDAFQPELISDPWVREFTEAVISSSIPIVLGGHSLVSGGVWALSERVRATGSAST